MFPVDCQVGCFMWRRGEKKSSSSEVSSIAGINLMLDVPQLPNDSQLLSLHVFFYISFVECGIRRRAGRREEENRNFTLERKEIHLRSPPSPAVNESYHGRAALVIEMGSHKVFKCSATTLSLGCAN
jgi:hypothetical protein